MVNGFSIEPFRDLYPFESQFIQLDSHRLHYLDEGQGETLLMLHGNPTWSFYYRNLIKGLRNQYRCVVPDHMEQGLLAGKYTKDTVIPEGQFRNNIPWFQQGNRERVIDMLDSWKDLLDKYNCKLSQLVIAWTTSVPGITTALCGGRKVNHVEENAGAGDIIIENLDIDRIKKDVVKLGQPV